MEWSDEHDMLLSREILTSEPFKAKRRTPEWGQLWQSVADHLNCIPERKFKVSNKSCTWALYIAEKFKNKMTAEVKASGIDTEINELDYLSWLWKKKSLIKITPSTRQKKTKAKLKPTIWD